MTFFEPNSSFKKAMENKDLETIRSKLVRIIGGDPKFVTSEFEEALIFLRNNDIEVTEQYVKQPDEIIKNDSDDWTEDYYGLLLVWLKDNFNLEERLEHIKTVGNYVYQNEKTYGEIRKEELEKTSSLNSNNKKNINELLKMGWRYLKNHF